MSCYSTHIYYQRLASSFCCCCCCSKGQKLILNGRTLTSLDHSKTLFECRVGNNSKVMVLGKRYDPQADEVFKQVAEVERRSLEVSKRLAEAAKEAQDIEDGYMPKENHAQVSIFTERIGLSSFCNKLCIQALKGLSKRCRSASEDFMRLLESLDSLSPDEHQTQARVKRKSVATDINASLDRAERLQSKLDQLLELAASK